MPNFYFAGLKTKPILKMKKLLFSLSVIGLFSIGCKKNVVVPTSAKDESSVELNSTTRKENKRSITLKFVASKPYDNHALRENIAYTRDFLAAENLSVSQRIPAVKAAIAKIGVVLAPPFAHIVYPALKQSLDAMKNSKTTNVLDEVSLDAMASVVSRAIFTKNMAAFQAVKANASLDSQLEEELERLDEEMASSESFFIQKYKSTMSRAMLNPFFKSKSDANRFLATYYLNMTADEKEFFEDVKYSGPANP